MTTLIPVEKITGKIYYIRNIKVMLDRDLAELYEVQTKALKQAVRRNRDRFPKDFMFQLSKKEWENIINDEQYMVLLDPESQIRYLDDHIIENGHKSIEKRKEKLKRWIEPDKALSKVPVPAYIEKKSLKNINLGKMLIMRILLLLVKPHLF